MNTDRQAAQVWMADGRSLCDRSTPTFVCSDATEAEVEVEALIALEDSAPACGARLLLLAHLRRRAAVMLRRHSRVWPTWEAHRGTRWTARFDLDEFSSREDVDSGSTFDAFMSAVGPASVDRLIAEDEATRVQPSEITSQDEHE